MLPNIDKREVKILLYFAVSYSFSYKMRELGGASCNNLPDFRDFRSARFWRDA
jgi:hypothetical protein